eukprot:TRINITY_DN57009_c0_g1_i1.p1 TRINITY_DN57009_c0_g1~~TRINITY_DN57009_c0_g1_i1.p1  ORF type:complete len:332 (+),score=68.78 TRINITY_DN57009_c0_g1_i1:83-1078(+)
MEAAGALKRSLYRRLLRKCKALECRLAQHPSVRSWSDVEPLLRRTHGVDDAKDAVRSISGEEPLFGSELVKGEILRAFPGLSADVRARFRVPASPEPWPEHAKLGFGALRVINNIINVYDRVLAPRPPPSPDSAYLIGEVVLCVSRKDGSTPCIVVGYQGDDKDVVALKYHVLRPDGSLGCYEPGELTSGVGVPIDGLEDPEGFFPAWCPRLRRYLPNSDLAFRWRLGAEEEVADQQCAREEAGAQELRFGGTPAASESWWVQLYYDYFPYPPPIPAGGRLRRWAARCRRLLIAWLYGLLPLLPPIRVLAPRAPILRPWALPALPPVCRAA